MEHTNNTPLQAGTTLSYSSGRQFSYQKSEEELDIDKFRVIKQRPSIFQAILERYPALGKFFKPTMMIINAYPASIGKFEEGVLIDSYLYPPTISRGLILAKQQNCQVVLTGQPLFLADVLTKHIEAGFSLPSHLVLALGGYPLSSSLERYFKHLLQSITYETLMFYGVSEVDAGCLYSKERNAQGENIYYTRKDVVITIIDGMLHLQLQEEDGMYPSQPFNTGDEAKQLEDGSLLIGYGKLLQEKSYEVLFKDWGVQDWQRKTGYIHVINEKKVFQTRQGISPEKSDEIEFHEFARISGYSWLNKPKW